MKERKTLPTSWIISFFGIYLLLYCAFPVEIVRKVRDQWKRCADCGQIPEISSDLQIHHRIPRCRGGSNNEKNAVPLCPTCHDIWDQLSIERNIYFPENLSPGDCLKDKPELVTNALVAVRHFVITLKRIRY